VGNGKGRGLPKRGRRWLAGVATGRLAREERGGGLPGCCARAACTGGQGMGAGGCGRTNGELGLEFRNK